MATRRVSDRLHTLTCLRFQLLLAVFLAMIHGCERKKVHLRTGTNPAGIGRTIDNTTLPDSAVGTITGSLASASGAASGPYIIHVEGFRNATTSASLGEAFTLSNVPVGERRIIVTDARSYPVATINLVASRFGARSDVITVSDGGTSAAGAITVAPAATVRGSVVGASPSGTSAFIPGTWFITTVDASGNYVLEGVPAGSYRIDVERPNYVKGYSDQITAVSGVDITVPPITIDTLMTPAGAIALESGARSAPSLTVRVDISQEPAATEIMLSEDPAFTGAAYQKLSETVEYTFAKDGPVTLYAKFRKSGLWETDAVSDNIIVDSGLPTGTIGLANDARYTNVRNVILAITGSDAAGISEMIVSEDENFTGASWISFATSLPFTLSEGDGEKTLYLKLRNEVGHDSAVISQTVGYDTLPPGSPSIVVGIDGYTNTLSAPVTLSATSAIAPVSEVMLSENSDLAGAVWQTYGDSATVTLSSGDGIKTVYGKYRDAAGNESQIVNASVILDTVVPTDPVLANTSGRIAAATSSTQIVFTTESTDLALKGYEVRGGQYASWTEKQKPIIFQLASADTWYTLEVRGKDRAGNVSNTSSLRIFHGDRTILAGNAGQLAATTTRSENSSALTLTAAYSPYFITGSGTAKTFTDYKLTVAADSLLEVDAGMILNLTNFTVNGESGHTVSLISAASSPASGDWRSLNLSGTIVLKYLNVSHNRYTLLTDTAVAPQISDSKFTKFNVFGVEDMSSGAGIFTHIEIDCSSAAIGYYGSPPSGATKSFTGSVVQGCSDGLGLEGSLAVSITGSNVTGNTSANVYIDPASSGSVSISGDYWGYTSPNGTLGNLKIDNSDSPVTVNFTANDYSTGVIVGAGPR